MKKLITLLACVSPSLAWAQSAVDVDPQHYQLVFENDCVRVVRAKYGPGEHNAGPYQSNGGVVIALTDLNGQRTTDDGQTATVTKKSGDAYWATPGKIKSLVNMSDKPAEWIAVVPKGKAGCTK